MTTCILTNSISCRENNLGTNPTSSSIDDSAISDTIGTLLESYDISRENSGISTQQNSSGYIAKPSRIISNANTLSGVSSSSVEAVDNTDHLYGVCYVYEQMKNRVKTSELVSLLTALGAKSVRIWNYSFSVMSDYKTIDSSKTTKYHEFYSALKFAGIDQIIGMNNYHFLPGSENIGTIQVPPRDTTAGSKYMKFLAMYQEMWKNLSAEFPEINYWEIGNELNHDPFLNPIGYTDGSNGVKAFTMNEKADISTDLMFYGSKGIKAGNSKATTIMPAMAPVDGMDGIAMTSYLERVYLNIESGKFGSSRTNDFFEALAWHPYSPFACPDQKWVDANNRLYAIAIAHGDNGKKVFLTEVGFPDGKNEKTDAMQADWVTTMYKLVKEQMPYVESLHYYRMFNDGDNDLYGLFNEPKDGFNVKAKGRAFQAIAGGKGNLDKYVINSSSYKAGDNIAYRLPVTASSSCEHQAWGWSKAGINDGDKFSSGWSNYYEFGEAPWVTSPTGGGSNSPTKPEWITFAFPLEWKINKVKLYSRMAINSNSHKIQGLPRDMFVEVSNDGKTWTRVADYSINEAGLKIYPTDVSNAGEPYVIEISFTAVATKNVRITFTKLDPYWAHSEGNYWVQLEEAEIIMAQ